MRNHVERDLLGERLLGLLVPHEDGTGLFEQLVHSRLARARHGLVGVATTTRLIRARSCSGLSATTSWAVEQLGLATMLRLE